MVGTLPPGDHTDPATPGLQLRVRAKAHGASRTWLLRYRWREEWVRIVLGHAPGMSLAEARQRAQELRKAIDDGIDPRRARPRRREPVAALSPASVRPDDKHSVEFLVSEFIGRYLRPNRKRPEYAEAILAKDVLPAWKGRDARTIDPGEVVDLLDGIVDRGSRVMANRTAALLSQLFRFGIHRHIVRTTPVQLLFRPGGKEKARQRTLTDKELGIFLADPQACTRYERLSRVMMVLLLTGQRRGELTLARWSQLDFDARTWTIPDENAKGGRGHVVPLTDLAIEEFRALQREAEGSPWVLPSNGGERHVDPKQLTRSVAKCQKRFKNRGVAEFTLHDLRRTCRTGLSRLKVEPHIAERVLNHAQQKIAGTYDRFEYLDEKRVALEKWAAHLATLPPS
ncbi:MAG: putative prophage integrase, partial [Rhodospirillales bacterium]|nr:putative prophage integrase [Rhodospirillales bacterium]